MLEQLYGWIQSIAVYLIVAAAVLQAIPGKEYKKYIQFFSGLVLILLLFTPILKLTGMAGTFTEKYYGREYEMQRQEIEKAAEKFEDVDILDFVPDTYGGAETEEESKIEVEEVEIGE